MKARSTEERRSGHDRRVGDTSADTRPERRQLKHRRLGLDRRGLLPNVCIYCGKVTGADMGRLRDSSEIETAVEHRNGICGDCSYERFPQLFPEI